MTIDSPAVLRAGGACRRRVDVGSAACGALTGPKLRGGRLRHAGARVAWCAIHACPQLRPVNNAPAGAYTRCLSIGQERATWKPGAVLRLRAALRDRGGARVLLVR